MTLYFCLFPSFILDPKKCCRNYAEPGYKDPKCLILCPGAKNGPNFRGNMFPMTEILTLYFECQVEQGNDISVRKGILKYSDF